MNEEKTYGHLFEFAERDMDAVMREKIAESDVTSLADKAVDACTIIGNCTTTIPMKFDFHDDEIGHAVVFGPSGKGMSAPLEMFQDQYQKRDGKLAVVDIGTSSSGFINEDKEA